MRRRLQRETQEGGAVYILMADSCCCMAESNIRLQNNYPSIKKKKHSCYLIKMVSLYLNKSQLMSSSQYKVVPIRIHLLKKKTYYLSNPYFRYIDTYSIWRIKLFKCHPGYWMNYIWPSWSQYGSISLQIYIIFRF